MKAANEQLNNGAADNIVATDRKAALAVVQATQLWRRGEYAACLEKLGTLHAERPEDPSVRLQLAFGL